MWLLKSLIVTIIIIFIITIDVATLQFNPIDLHIIDQIEKPLNGLLHSSLICVVIIFSRLVLHEIEHSNINQ